MEKDLRSEEFHDYGWRDLRESESSSLLSSAKNLVEAFNMIYLAQGSVQLVPEDLMPLVNAIAAYEKSGVYVVFDGPPGPEGPRFVEVEDDSERSVRIGKWQKGQKGQKGCEGYWRLGPFYAGERNQDYLGDFSEES